jgi:glycosyltransferase involved in cell wall biosynthesis
MRVSVLVTCYRRREYLASAVASVLRSTIPPEDREVVVVTDELEPALAEQWRGLGVEVVVSDLPVVGEMLRTGLEHCHGDVVSFLDDDDMVTPEKLRIVRDAFASDADLGLFRAGFDPIDGAGTRAGVTGSTRGDSVRESAPGSPGIGATGI